VRLVKEKKRFVTPAGIGLIIAKIVPFVVRLLKQSVILVLVKKKFVTPAGTGPGTVIIVLFVVQPPRL
jgi:predicted small secreted protein